MSVNQLKQYQHPDGYLINGGGSPGDDIGSIKDDITSVNNSIASLTDSVTYLVNESKFKHAVVPSDTVLEQGTGDPNGYFYWNIASLSSYMRNTLKIDSYYLNILSMSYQVPQYWWAIIGNGVNSQQYPYYGGTSWQTYRYSGSTALGTISQYNQYTTGLVLHTTDDASGIIGDLHIYGFSL